MREVILSAIVWCAVAGAAFGQEKAYELPLSVGEFEMQVHRPYTMEDGLPDNDVDSAVRDGDGNIVAVTAQGTAVFNGQHWQELDTDWAPARLELDNRQLAALQQVAGPEVYILDAAEYEGEIAVAADGGLYIGDGQDWRMALPRQGAVRWAPVDVRAVTYDASGRLWFAAVQGVGYRISDGEWQLFTGADGLPYNDFTCIAAGPKGVWFGTTNGAIHFRDGSFAFRQGRRWLLDNHVRGIAVDAAGNAWLATPKGVSCIAYEPMTLAKKAAFFAEELENYHRRTEFGYVAPARLAVPGDKSTATTPPTRNDGQRIGMYLGAVGLGYAATGDPALKQDAVNAFRAAAFLTEVTQGGSHPGPRGLIARAVTPVTGPDPNEKSDLAYDLRNRERDGLWKILQPRWPVDETGQWYWEADGSADELDGLFFGYGIYFDHVCETEVEKDAVRGVVRDMADHLIENGYNIVDYDGTPTRWGRFSPEDLNRNEAWVIERGLRSYSILAYLSAAHHITGDPKYREAYLELALDYGYGMNGMTQPRDIAGPGTFGHGDDKMAFLNYYHLLRYETDPKLLSMYYRAIHRHWQMEQYERCPWATFIYAACCLGKIREDQWGVTDLTPPRAAFEDAIDTLKRYPLDLIDWPISNAHRIDLVPLQEHLGYPKGIAGHRADGFVFPIDERPAVRWGADPYLLTGKGNGDTLQKGVHYLLAYYMGRAHGFISE
jgi:hypothetical protein